MTHRFFKLTFCLSILVLPVLCAGWLLGANAGVSPHAGAVSHAGEQSAQSSNAADAGLARSLGIEFVKGSASTFVLERNGKKYLVDLANRTVREIGMSAAASATDPRAAAPASALVAEPSEGAQAFKKNCSICHGPDGKGLASVHTPDFTNPRVQASITDDQMLQVIKHGIAGTPMPAFGNKLPPDEIKAIQGFVRSLNAQNQVAQAGSAQAGEARKHKIYEPGDDKLVTLPTGRRLARHGLYVNFAHRFPFDPAFSGTARGGALLGLDGFALPSFGFRYGITSRWTAGIYREPSTIGRPIQLSTGYNFLDEHDGAPLNVAVRFAIQGQNDFGKDYTESLEGIASRSLGARAQLYVVPTVSFDNRPLQTVNGFEASDIIDLPGHNTFSLGAGGSLDIRPTVALIAEVIPTLANGRPMGILRPAFSFGIQKKIWRHAFTFGFTTAPGVSVADRAGTRASLLGRSSADTPSGLFIGFDVTRRLF